MSPLVLHWTPTQCGTRGDMFPLLKTLPTSCCPVPSCWDPGWPVLGETGLQGSWQGGMGQHGSWSPVPHASRLGPVLHVEAWVSVVQKLEIPQHGGTGCQKLPSSCASLHIMRVHPFKTGRVWSSPPYEDAPLGFPRSVSLSRESQAFPDYENPWGFVSVSGETPAFPTYWDTSQDSLVHFSVKGERQASAPGARSIRSCPGNPQGVQDQAPQVSRVPAQGSWKVLSLQQANKCLPQSSTIYYLLCHGQELWAFVAWQGVYDCLLILPLHHHKKKFYSCTKENKSNVRFYSQGF